jgi:hypothetical protein
MRKHVRVGLFAVTLAIGLTVAGSASGLLLHAGNLIVSGDGGFAPRSLPRDRFAPIRAFFHGRIRTVDGTRPSPIRKLVLEVDRHTLVETRGLPKCSKRKLIATTTKQARHLCPGAIIGTGVGSAEIELPEQRPVEVSSPITIFNGPEVDGNPTGIGHAHLDYPAPATYLVQSEVERIHRGRYGYRIEINLPKILNDYGSAVYGRVAIDRKWTFEGKQLSIANARCADGRLQARVQATFKDGTFLEGSAFKRCTVRR